MNNNLKPIEKRIAKLEKLKQIAAYRYSQGQTSDLKEIIDLEKISLSTDRQELVKALKREDIYQKTIMDIVESVNSIETIDKVKNMIADLILQTGFEPTSFDKYINPS